jgi:hypothetical protein
MATSTQLPLHPPRLAHTFVGTPSAPGTPVHSIQTMRRKSAGHSGPLTKILVANRGVRFDPFIWVSPSLRYLIYRKSLSESSVPLMSSLCTPSRSTRMRIVSRLIVRRYLNVMMIDLYNVAHQTFLGR